MSPKYQQIANQALELDPEDRYSLVEELLQSLDKEEPVEVDDYWDKIAVRRFEELESGKVKGIPGEEVHQNVLKLVNELRLSRRS